MCRHVEFDIVKLTAVALAGALLLAGGAWGQSAPVYQMGTALPNDLAKIERNGQIRNPGTIAGDNNGVGVNPFAATDYGQPGICSNSNKTTGPYNQICLGHSATGKPRIEINASSGSAHQVAEICNDGTCTDFPFSTSGVVGQNPTDVNFLAVWDNLTGTLLRQTKQTVFPAANTGWGNVGGLVSVSGARNALVGATINDLPPATTAFNTGVTGYALIRPGSNGNTAFGMYAETDLAAVGTAIGAEIDCMNYSGTPSTSLPPNRAIGTTDNNCVGLQIGAGGAFDGAVGLTIGGGLGGVYAPGSGGLHRWNTGIYMGGGLTPATGGAKQYGIFIDADATGPMVGMAIQNNGNGLNLQLGINGTVVPDNAVLDVVVPGNIHPFSVRASGDVYTRGKFQFQQTARPTLTSCGSGGSVNRSNDHAGVITVGTGGTINACTVIFNVPFKQQPACVISPSAGMPTLWVAAGTSVAQLQAASAGNMAGFNFTYVCFDQP